MRADPERVLHEFVPDPDEDELSSVVRGAAGGGEAPEAIVYDGEVLARPAGGERRPDEAAMSALPGSGRGREAPGRRSPTFRPDRNTSLEETLGYYAVFTPTVAPFKRVTGLDAVVQDAGGVPVLGIASPEGAPEPVGDRPATDGRARDRFWGNVILDFRRGDRVPFPAVAAEARVLSLETDPPVALRLERDRADNLYAIAPPGERGEVRAIFLMDAPRDYFAVREIPDAPVDALADEVFPLEQGVRRDALLFARELGLGAESTLRKALETLTDHFRAFREASGTLAERDTIFLDLARSMRGVCRHRVYAFVITAQALGIPARFAQNEAHAWAEVKLAGRGWMRIDLGGAANGLDARNAADRPVYRSRIPDPLPQPPAYRESYSQLRGAVTGFRPGEAGGTAGSALPGPAPGTGAGAGAGSAGATAASRATRGGATEEGSSDPLDAIFGPSEPLTPEPAPRPVRMSVAPREAEVYRGQTLTFQGLALDPDDGGVSGLRVEVLLQGPTERLLGVTVTRPDGSYRATVGVPPELPVGHYRLVVRTPGDEAHLPATAH